MRATCDARQVARLATPLEVPRSSTGPTRRRPSGGSGNGHHAAKADRGSGSGVAAPRDVSRRGEDRSKASRRCASRTRGAARARGSASPSGPASRSEMPAARKADRDPLLAVRRRLLSAGRVVWWRTVRRETARVGLEHDPRIIRGSRQCETPRCLPERRASCREKSGR